MEQLTLSMKRSTAKLLATSGVLLAVLLFGTGYWTGRTAPPGPVSAPDPDPDPVEVGGDAKKAAIEALPTAAGDAPKPRTEAAPKPAAGEPPPDLKVLPPPKEGWGIQLGAFASREEAEHFVLDQPLRRAEVHIVPTPIPGRGIWHRVRVGRYASKADAENARRRLPLPIRESAIVISYK